MSAIIDNYDTSSTGTDIELSVFWDGESSRMDFEDNFQSVDTRGTYWIASQEKDSIRYASECLDFSECSYKDLRKFCLSCYDSVRECMEEKLCDWGNERGTWIEFAKECIDEFSLADHMRDGFPSIDNAKLLYGVQQAQGSCQGDWALVLYRLDDWNEDSNLFEIFSRMFFQAPLRCTLAVDGEEHFLCENIKDLYEYDRNEILEIVKRLNLGEQVEEFVESRLPEWPQYL